MDPGGEDESPLSALNISAGLRRDSTGTGDSNGSVRDDAESFGLSDADLEEFLNAENLSDQTPGGLCLYDCSLSTDLEKSLSQANNSLNNVSECNATRHINDLSCSLADDCEHCISLLPQLNAEKIVDQITSVELKKDEIIKELCTVLGEANDWQAKKIKKNKELLSQVSWLKENFNGFSSLTACSLADEKRQSNGNNTNSSTDTFRLSSYVRAKEARNKGSQSCSLDDAKEPVTTECRSMQTSPLPDHDVAIPVTEQPFNQEIMSALCQSFLSTTKSLKDELIVMRQLIKQPYENRDDFPIQKIVSCLQEISKSHESEISSYQQQLSSESKHHHEVQNALKDEIKTLKMRFQDKIKQRDSEISELKARMVETKEIPEQLNDVDSPRSDPVETPNRTGLDDSFHSMSDEETFSNLLSRTKMEYLKLTPSEYVEDEVIDTVHIPDTYRQLLEDYKLKLYDMEKKFDSNKRYLEEQTHDREVERDEFQQTLDALQQQIEDLKRENVKLYEVNKQNVFQIEEYAARLKSAEEDEMEMAQKHDTTEKDLKAAIDKIYELREIIRDLESQVDAMSVNAIQLKEQNQVLLDELEKQEMTNKREQPVFNEQETYGTIPLDVTDEIQTQLQDLARRIEGKINEMDNFQSQTRPNSSCSGVAFSVSTEDISCRELAGRSSRNFENFRMEDFGSVILNEIRRLDSQFESLVRFEDVVMKKLKDAELRCSGQKNKIEELENQIIVYQEKCSQQAIKIADLEGRVDAMRFDTTNQSVISSLKTRLQATTKQLEEHKNLCTKREQELSKIKEELRSIQLKELEKQVDHKEVQTSFPPEHSQTFESSIRLSENTFEDVSPEKIRRMESLNPLSTSVISLHKNIMKETQPIGLEAELPLMKPMEYDDEEMADLQNRSDMEGGGDMSSPNIEEMDNNLQELHRLLMEKDKIIRALENKVAKKKGSKGACAGHSHQKHSKDGNCEQEEVTTDMNLHGEQKQGPSARIGQKAQQNSTEPCIYEATYSSEYAVEGDLLKYIGTRLLHEGPKRANSLDYGQGRVAETDRQIEIATLNTQIQQLKRALEEERKKSDNLAKQLRSCEEAKAELRSRSPLTRAPVQNLVSSVSVQQMQQRELVHQIEEGRNLLNSKHKEMRLLQDKIHELETKLSAKSEHEHELRTRLNSTGSLLKKCEEHGRELTASNQDHMKEIRRLKGLLEKINSRNNNDVCQVMANHTGGGGDNLENFLRAKSHRKALAWQKKYLLSVIVGYKSIVRQIGHGTEHPALIQTQIPLAPCAVGLYEGRNGKIRFRIIVFSVLAVIRMRYMVNRWFKKRPGEGSPDSEYKSSRYTSKVDSSVLRPSTKSILAYNKPNYVAQPPVVESRGGNVDTISEYISRFETIENEISSSLSRKFPS